MSDTKPDQPGHAPATDLSRRRLLKQGAYVAAAGAASGLFGLPYGAMPSAWAADSPLDFWQFYAPGGQVAAQTQWFESMVSAWNASHDQKIKLQYIPNTDYISGSKLPTAFAAGDGPDIFLVSAGQFLRYYNGGALLDLSPFISKKAAADYPKEIIASRVVDDHIYAVPMEVEPMAMYYSVKAFDDAGLNENDVPKTWDELLEVAQKLTTNKRYGVVFETAPGYYQNFTWYPFFWQGGGSIQNSQGGSGFDSKAAVQALAMWQKAIKQQVAPRKLLGNGGPDVVANLGSGYCAMQNAGSWGIAALRQNAPDFEYGVFRLPIPQGGNYVTIGGGWALCANARGANPKAAGEFCAWAVASMSQGSIDRVVKWCTEAKSDMPPRKSVLKAAHQVYSTGKMGTFAKEIYQHHTRAEPRVPENVNKIISNAIQATQLNGQDPAQQAKSASQQLDAYLASYNGAPIV